MSEYVVIFEQAEDGGWGAYLPDLPGVVALGTSREEVTDRIEEALHACAEEMRELGRPLPEPLHAAGRRACRCFTAASSTGALSAYLLCGTRDSAL